MDMSAVSGLAGIIKIVTIVVGIVDLGVTADAYIKVSEEEYYLSIVIIALLTSVIFLILTLMKLIPNTNQWRQIDMGVHAAMAVLIAIGAIVMANSTAEWRHWVTNRYYAQRIVSSVLGFLNAILYGFVSFVVFRSSSS